MAKTLQIFKAVLLLTLIVNLTNILGGCDSDPSKSISKFIDQASSKVSQVAPDPGKVSELTQDEISKLFTFEYKVVELDAALSSKELELKLSELGKEMWECFSVAPVDSTLKVFCKRRPKTYLRYIPRWF